MELKSILTVTFYLIYAAYADHVTYKKVCYYTNWSQYREGVGKFLPKDIDPFLCTHVVYAFAKLSGNRIVPQEWNDETVPWKKGLYEKVTDLKKINPKLRVLLSVGGWSAGGQNFSKMAATEAGRKEFATSTVTYLRKRLFDGVDIDWEFPGSLSRGGDSTDKENLSLLLNEVSTVFKNEVRDPARERLLLSIAVPASEDKIDQGFKVADVSSYCDMINVMTYNYHGKWDNTLGHHSALFKRNVDTTEYQSKLNMAWTINYWISKGAQASKLIVGFSPFGRGFTLADQTKKALGDPARGGNVAGSSTKETGFLSYYEICKMINTGAKVTWDDVQKVPHLVLGNQWIGYDNQQSIKEKVKWLKNYRFGGIMVWALPLDDFKGNHCNRNETYPFIRNIIRELNKPDRTIDQSPVSPDVPTPASSQQVSPDQVRSNTVLTDTMQGVPLVSLSSSKAIVRLKNAKDLSGPVVTGEKEQKNPRKTSTKPTSSTSDPKKEVLSEAFVNPNKVSSTKIKSSATKQPLKTSSIQSEPLVNLASSSSKNHKTSPKTDGKERKGPIIQETSTKIETTAKSKLVIDAKTPIVTATVLSDSITKNHQSQRGDIGKAKVLNEVELTKDKIKAATNVQKTTTADTGKKDPLIKTVVKASQTITQHDSKKIVGPKLKKNETKIKTSVKAKPGNDADLGTRLSSAIVTKGTAAKKIGKSVFTEGQPMYSAPDVNDLRLNSRNSGATEVTGKQPVLKHLKDKKQTQPIIDKDITAVNVATNIKKDATITNDQSKESHKKPGMESGMKTTTDSTDSTASGKTQIEKVKAKPTVSQASTKFSKDKTETKQVSKTHSGPQKGKEKVSLINVKPSVNSGESSSKFTSRKLLQMSDNDGMNGGGLGNMISSLFGMMSGFTGGGNGREQAQEPRNDLFPTASSVTENPASFNAGSNDNRLSRQRQRFLNDRRERQRNSRDRQAVAINNRERSINSLDRARNTGDRSSSRNGRERSGVAVDRASNIRNRFNPVDTLTDVSPIPPTANSFDVFDIRDPRERGGISPPLRGGRNVGIQEQLMGRPVEDTRTARERFLDAMILAEQLPDPRPLDSRNGIRSRDQLRSEAELLLTRDQLGINDPFQRDRLQSQIRDPALIRSREPGLVETLRRRMSDAGRERGNSGVATNILTPERGGSVQADSRQSIGVNSRSSNLRRNMAGIDRQRSAIGIQSQGRDRQRNAIGVGSNRRRTSAVGVQDAGSERQRQSIGVQNVGNDRQRTSVGVQSPDRQRTSVAVQSTGTATDRRTSTGIQSVAASRQRTRIGVQGLGQRTAIGVQNNDRQRSLNGQGTGSDRQRSTVGISLQNGRGNRQRPAIGVQGPSNDRQRTGVGIQSSDRQRAAVGVQGSTNDRQRTGVGVTNVGRQRTAIGVPRSGNDRQRTSIGVQSSTSDRSRTGVGVTNAGRQRTSIGVQRSGNDRQRSIGVQSSTNDRSRAAVGITNADRQRTAIGVQRSGNDRQRTSIGVQSSTNDRSRTAAGVANADRQRTAIGVQRSGNDLQRTSVGVEGTIAERQRTSIGVQNADRQRTAIGVQRLGNDRQRTAVGVEGATGERQRTSIGVQNADRQRTAIGVQRVGNDRQRTAVGVESSTGERQRTAVGVQNADRRRTAIGVQRVGNDRQRTAVGVESSTGEGQRTAVGVQNADWQRTAIGVQRAGNDRQRTSVGVRGGTSDLKRGAVGVTNPGRPRTAVGVQRSGSDRQRISVGIEGTTNERQRSAVGISNADRQRTSIGVQSSGNERQRTSVGIQSSVNDRQRPSIGVQNIDRQRTAIGVESLTGERRRTAVGVSNADRQRTAIGIQRSGIEGQRTSVGVQSMLTDRQRPTIGIQNADRQRTSIGVKRSGNDRQRTSVGIQGPTNDRQRIAVGVQNADRKRTAIGVQNVGNDRQGTAFDINDLQRTVINVQSSSNDRQRTAIGVQGSRNDIQNPLISLQRTAIGIQAAGDINQRPIISTGGAISDSRRTVATNSLSGALTDRQTLPVSTERRTIAVNTISDNKSGSLNSIIGTISPESNRQIGISGNTWQTSPQNVAVQERGTQPVALITELNNRNAIENSIGELLAQINAQQLSTAMEKTRPTVSITPADPLFDSSIRVVPLNDNSLLNNMPMGPPIQILNNTEILPSTIAVANNVNSIGGSNTFDLINSLSANRMSMPDSPMSNSLTPEKILAAMAVAQSRPANDVVNEPIVLEIQPQILPTEPPLSKDITDALVQLLRDNLLNQNTPPQATPAPFKQDAMQTPNQVLVSTGEQPKEFPPLPPPPRRQTSSLATNATVVANNNQPKGLTKADVLWKWEA